MKCCEKGGNFLREKASAFPQLKRRLGFNNRHARSGHLFQGRLKSLIVENDAHLVRFSCYIHRNPLRAWYR